MADSVKSPETGTGVSEGRLASLHRYWQAVNYLGAAQLYLKENPLLKEPLRPEHIKPRLLGHWGTQPGLNFIYAHLNRLIQDTEASILLVVGPGHGAPAILANLYLEGSLAHHYEGLGLDMNGLKTLMRQFSWPEGAPSHIFPGTPGTIQEGGELGYCLSHAFGAVLDNPDLISVCIVGDGEAETGPLATSWHSNNYLDPVGSGAVLPILHLNGYKIGGPTIMGRMSDDELQRLFSGLGYRARMVAGDDPPRMHRLMWEAADWAYGGIRDIQKSARAGKNSRRPAWPLIILRTPKGWTGPEDIDGRRIEGNFPSHQLPVTDPANNPEHLKQLQEWLRGYHPESLFDEAGRPLPETIAVCPQGGLRLGMNAHANGGELLIPLRLPPYEKYALKVTTPGKERAKATTELAKFLRDVFRENEQARNFRFFCPDEITSNRMQPIFEATSRAFVLPVIDTDEHLAPEGRVMEILSEHTCEGWLEGYLLTGRHGIFACYEAFIPIVDSMLNQYAKWLKVSHEIPWRAPLASLNYLLTSHVWRQDHNGYSHQVPSFIDNVVNKKGSVSRIYLPPDANCLLAVADRCLKSRDYVNLIIASKNAEPQWLDIESARRHCDQGVSVWEWAGYGSESADVILACAGDIPTEETLAAATLLRKEFPELNFRVVNVVDLFSIMSHRDHPHGLDDENFVEIFTEDRPVIFAFHGYPHVIHELIHHRPNPARFHVHGYMEEGYTTTPFDMLVLNNMSRYQLAIAAAMRVKRLNSLAGDMIDIFKDRLRAHKRYIRENNQDLPEVVNWSWSRPG
ncbi:MAG: phosphoketolase family protein [Thermoleophilia bacterium]|nr:phosphoketolase family protein [Thermoleophilia bacterium]